MCSSWKLLNLCSHFLGGKFLGGDHIPDCLHCGSWKFVLIWNVQSHADDVVGCNSHFAVTANWPWKLSPRKVLFLLALFMYYCWCIWHLGCNSPISDHVTLESHHVAFWMCGAKVMSSWMIILQNFSSQAGTKFFTVAPWEHACEEGGVLGLARYAHLDDFALLQATWQGLLGDVELQPIACPVEALSLAGDQDTDLTYFCVIGIGSNPYCTHAHTIIITTDMLHMHMETCGSLS